MVNKTLALNGLAKFVLESYIELEIPSSIIMAYSGLNDLAEELYLDLHWNSLFADNEETTIYNSLDTKFITHKKIFDNFIEDYANGCGTAGWKGGIIPDTNYGLCITEACNHHDFDWSFSKPNFESFMFWNFAFLHNHFLIINNRTTKNFLVGKILKNLRVYRAISYFLAVSSEIGWGAFCSATGNKTENNEYAEKIEFFMDSLAVLTPIQMLKYMNDIYTNKYTVKEKYNRLPNSERKLPLPILMNKPEGKKYDRQKS